MSEQMPQDEARVPMRRAQTRRAPVEAPISALPVSPFEMKPTGLQLHGSPTLEACIDYASKLGSMDSACKWTLGDLLLYMESRPDFAETWTQAINQMQKSEDSLLTVMNVCRKIPTEKRRTILSFAHHRDVVALDEHEREAWLDKAEAEGLSSKQLRELIKQAKPRELKPLDGGSAAPRVASVVLIEDGGVEVWDVEAEARRRAALLHRQGVAAEVKTVFANREYEVDGAPGAGVSSAHGGIAERTTSGHEAGAHAMAN
jgi:hypothetical protein